MSGWKRCVDEAELHSRGSISTTSSDADGGSGSRRSSFSSNSWIPSSVRSAISVVARAFRGKSKIAVGSEDPTWEEEYEDETRPLLFKAKPTSASAGQTPLQRPTQPFAGAFSQLQACSDNQKTEVHQRKQLPLLEDEGPSQRAVLLIDAMVELPKGRDDASIRLSSGNLALFLVITYLGSRTIGMHRNSTRFILETNTRYNK